MPATTEQLHIVYPESDGKPMAENTLQFEWIVLIKLGLDACFAERADVFIAGDLLWYPVEGNPAIRQAPDVMAVVGRPKGYRGSYLQWQEGGIAPQVVFEILSPGNRAAEMRAKLAFYERYGVQEYYVYNPHNNRMKAYLRQGAGLVELPAEALRDWVSPALGICLRRADDTLHLYEPDGKPFRPYLALIESEAAAVDELKQNRELLQQTLKRLKEAEVRAQSAEHRAEKLAEQLRRLGIDPDSI